MQDKILSRFTTGNKKTAKKSNKMPASERKIAYEAGSVQDSFKITDKTMSLNGLIPNNSASQKAFKTAATTNLQKKLCFLRKNPSISQKNLSDSNSQAGNISPPFVKVYRMQKQLDRLKNTTIKCSNDSERRFLSLNSRNVPRSTKRFSDF